MSRKKSLLSRSALAVFLAASSLSGAAFAPNSAFAASPPPSDAPLKLKKLTVSGNQKISTADILAAVPFHVGDTVTQDQIASGLQEVMGLYKKQNIGGSFGQKSKFVGKTIEVEWVITEQAAAEAPALVLDSVNFVGNKKITAADLTAATKLRAGSGVSETTIMDDQKAIQALYKSKGVGVKIAPSVTYPNHDNHVVLTYTFEEQSSD